MIGPGARLTELQIKNIMEQVLLTIDFVHKQRLIHRDVKLDNILIKRAEGNYFEVKLADFGLTVELPDNRDEKLWDLCGTPCYVAPEMLRK